MIKIYKALDSVFFKEGICNYLKRKNVIKNLKGIKVHPILFHGNTVKIKLSEKNGYVDKYIYKWGVYEKKIFEKVLDIQQKRDVFIDVGANIGQHSLIFSRYFKKVFSFEPNNEIYKQFEESIQINDFKNIEAINFGIGASKKTLKLYVNPENAGHASVLEQYKNENYTIINIDKIEDLLPDLNEVNLVKIDVEGLELEVILGNLSFFKRFLPNIIIEYNHKEYIAGGYSETDFLAFIKENNYNIYSFQANRIVDKLPIQTDNLFLFRK